MNNKSICLLVILSLSWLMNSTTFAAPNNLKPPALPTTPPASQPPELFSCGLGQQWYHFYNNSTILRFASIMNGTATFERQQILVKMLIRYNHRFFTVSQIISILSSVAKDVDNGQGQIQLLILMKPYIPMMTVSEAVSIFNAFQNASFTLVSNILIQMICDIDKADLSQLMNSIYYPTYFREKYYTYSLYQNHKQLLTIEGQFTAFLYDSSDSMFNPITVVDSATSTPITTTRWNYLKEFYSQSFGLNSNIDVGFSSLLSSYNSYYPSSRFLHGMDNVEFSKIMSFKKTGDGETDLYSAIEGILQNPYDQLSDLFIVSDGLVTKGVKDINMFVKLIQRQNGIKKTKVRINTISVLIGGAEKQRDREQATKLLKAIADCTDGTFIEYIPQ